MVFFDAFTDPTVTEMRVGVQPDHSKLLVNVNSMLVTMLTTVLDGLRKDFQQGNYWSGAFDLERKIADSRYTL